MPSTSPGDKPVSMNPAQPAGQTTTTPEQVSDDELAGLVELMDEATDAYISGRTHHYFSLFDHPAEYSLMPPYGGETRTDMRRDEESIAEISRFFVSGEGRFDLQHAMRSGELAVLAGIERQHGQVSDLPEQDWSLRVTLVFRRVGDRWQLLHRHADPLVREVPFDHCAKLARGAFRQPPGPFTRTTRRSRRSP